MLKRTRSILTNAHRLVGDMSQIRGDATDIRGDVTGIRGDVTGLEGDLDDCGLTPEMRKQGVDVATLVG